MKRVAYGCSKLLHLYLDHTGDRFDCVVDANYSQSAFHDHNVVRPDRFATEYSPANTEVFIFAVSNSALTSIISFLAKLAFQLGKQAHLYSKLFSQSFQDAAYSQLSWMLDERDLLYATSFTLNSRKPVHTTLCGSWLFLAALRQTKSVDGHIAEVGAYEGGNALCALQSTAWSQKNFYLFDSFEGFPDLSPLDPANFHKGDYQPINTLSEILAPLVLFPEAKVIKGFVPETFSQLDPAAHYSLVFYDCDLYQPALDTFNYFWDRISPGGILLVHDYFSEPGGFTGVKDATDAFFKGAPCKRAAFWQSTMAVYVKP